MKRWLLPIALCIVVAPEAAALTPLEMLRAGSGYAEQGAASKAVPLLERALRSNKLSTAEQARAHLGLGRSFAQLDRADKAIAHLEQAIALDASLQKAYLLLGMTHDLNEQPDKALEVYRRGIRALPGDPDLLHELGLTELIAGEVESAIGHLRQARDGRPHSASLLGDLGYAELRAGRFEAAVTTLTEALAFGDGDADLLTHLGDAYAGAGKPTKALDCYARALELEPGKLRARYHQGLLQAKQGKLVPAIASFRGVLRREPRHRRAAQAVEAALAQITERPPREAEKTLHQVVEAEPSFAAAHVELGRLALARKDLQAARKHLEDALARDPDQARARELLRGVLEAQGDTAALEALQQREQAEPDAGRKRKRRGGR